MTTKPKQDRAWLLATAKAVASQLKERSGGTRLRIRIPSRATKTDTDGWSAIVGDLGKGEPRLEVWFDMFSGYPNRRLYAGLCSESRAQISAITRRVAQELRPVRKVTADDTKEGMCLALAKRLGRSEFNAPVLEQYEGGRTFYGIYDPTRETAERASPHFCMRATAFFEDVARALPRAKGDEEEREVFPRHENRKHVTSHLRREKTRSESLASACKIRDDFKCQVCGLRFETAYGTLGREFAEAHHIVPLAKLRENVMTRLEDLATVCANCHRMLHRMEGSPRDIRRLKKIVQSQRKGRT